jgi:hypothetical protein
MRRINGWLTLFWIVMISLSYAMGWTNSTLLLGRLIQPLGPRFVVAEVVGNCSREERTGRASYCDERTARAAKEPDRLVGALCAPAVIRADGLDRDGRGTGSEASGARDAAAARPTLVNPRATIKEEQ